MMRFLGFASLLALHLSLVVLGEEVIIDARLDSWMNIDAPEADAEFDRCTIETSEGIEYEIYPKNNFTGSHEGYYRCDVRVKVKRSSAGVWTMNSYRNDTSSATKTKYTVIVTQGVTLRPAKSISAYRGQWVTAWIDEQEDDITVCNVTSPQGRTYDLINEKIEWIQRYSQCGVRIFVNKTYGGIQLGSQEGQWEITKQIGNYVFNHADLRIEIPSENEPKDQVADGNQPIEQQRWPIGKSVSREWYDSRVIFCQWTRPDGIILPKHYGYCKLSVDPVTEIHSGIWRATYATSNKINVNYLEINVTVYDPRTFEGTYFIGAHGEINLLCKTGVSDLKYCSYIRPDKEIINLPAGVGNDKYSYYGNGFKDRYSPDRNYGECGLTIHKPSEVDFGIWTCEVVLSTSTIQTRSTIIDVQKSRTELDVRGKIIDHSQVFVKRGDDFTVRCTVNAVLKYCWLTSPNGTFYGVTPEGSSETSLEYTGMGFSMGDCGAIVKNANDTDNGEWTCHLGVDDSAEIEGKVSVKVTESYLIAVNETVTADAATLTCRTFLETLGTLQYCRWVRPNGHGINIDDAHRYNLTKNIHECSLILLNVQPDDIGQWSCIASLTRASNQEELATVNLTSGDDQMSMTASVLSIVLGTGLLAITLVGALVAGVYFYRKRNFRNVKSPPPYYPNVGGFPIGIQSDPENIPNKDSKY